MISDLSFRFEISDFRFEISDLKFEISVLRFQISDFSSEISAFHIGATLRLAKGNGNARDETLV